MLCNRPRQFHRVPHSQTGSHPLNSMQSRPFSTISYESTPIPATENTSHSVTHSQSDWSSNARGCPQDTLAPFGPSKPTINRKRKFDSPDHIAPNSRRPQDTLAPSALSKQTINRKRKFDSPDYIAPNSRRQLIFNDTSSHLRGSGLPATPSPPLSLEGPSQSTPTAISTASSDYVSTSRSHHASSPHALSQH